MVELELQALALTREGLLIDVGRVASECGFTLRRQRLVQDPHGVLLTMAISGPPRRQRKLEAALDAHERLISFQLSPFDDAAPPKPHFAASRPAQAAPAPSASAPAAVPAPPSPPPASRPADPPSPAPSAAVVVPTQSPPDTLAPDPPAVPLWEELAALSGAAVTPAPQPPVHAAEAAAAELIPPPPADLVPSGPDTAAVETLHATLASEYPRIMPRLQALVQAVKPAAREASLALAGQDIGAWVWQREYAATATLAAEEAITQVGLPALQALVEAIGQGGQLHIRNSPLCGEGHSGCLFYSGFLEGLLTPVMASGTASIFPVCCRSFGADECVLAVSD